MVSRRVLPGSERATHRPLPSPIQQFSSRPWFRPLYALGGVLNILLMMTANLVGFVVGIDGAKSRSFLLTACACLFVAVQVMFEYREEERRRGIYRRC
ncbi:hypothetical protein JCM8547_007728 [Rhodosporidiobolus lusitaniae]